MLLPLQLLMVSWFSNYCCFLEVSIPLLLKMLCYRSCRWLWARICPFLLSTMRESRNFESIRSLRKLTELSETRSAKFTSLLKEMDGFGSAGDICHRYFSSVWMHVGGSYHLQCLYTDRFASSAPQLLHTSLFEALLVPERHTVVVYFDKNSNLNSTSVRLGLKIPRVLSH